MSFDETYLNTEMQYLDSVSSVAKPNKLSTNLEDFVALSYWKKKVMRTKSLKSSQILRAHMPCFRRSSHIYVIYYLHIYLVKQQD